MVRNVTQRKGQEETKETDTLTESGLGGDHTVCLLPLNTRRCRTSRLTALWEIDNEADSPVLTTELEQTSPVPGLLTP